MPTVEKPHSNTPLGEMTQKPEVELYTPFRGWEDQGSMEVIDAIWRLHADNYFRNGYVTADAIDHNGHISPEIDHARGGNVEYLASLDANQVVASVRKIHIPVDAGIESLPAFVNCAGGLSEEGRDYLLAMQASGRSIVEIAALAKQPKADPLAVLEIYRNGIQDSLRRNELWFMGLVPETLKLLQNVFGDKIVTVAGEPTTFDDGRIADSVSLTPVIIDPEVVLGSLLEDSLEARRHHDWQRAYEAENLLIGFADGLSPELRGEKVERAISDMKQGISLDVLAQEAA